MVIILGSAAGVPLPALVTAKGIAPCAASQAFRPHNVCGFFLARLSGQRRAARVGRGLRSMPRARACGGQLQNEIVPRCEM